MTAAKRTVALLAPFPEALSSLLLANGYDITTGSSADAAQATAAVTRGSLPMGPVEFDGLPNLCLLCCWGSGHDGIDLTEAHRRGVVVANSPGTNAAGVADLAIGFVIALLRRLPVADRYIRSGEWTHAASRLPAVPGLTGARLGIYGFGEVGQRVAVRAQALEMMVGAFSRNPPSNPSVSQFAALEALAQWADVLVITAPGNAATFHTVNAHVLEALGSQGFLVNVSRGSIIDEAALCHALDERRLAGFAADVFEFEPAVPVAALTHPNVLLSPHIGGATQMAQTAQCQAVLGNLDAYFRTGAPVHKVS
jgi:lactate dehydrogenase-like 2-hydroxyacid dehydrogenase